ncbi:alpha-L-rhamnosidase [Anaerocolumna xylanovorans]|uniref:alpha-L-rhamnosidase n=1 Tax=Anaerocolumna xylanovorans DSM 12503 TaxID=1121345 RepID=A0A1M7Y1L3_9FIRM|nr:alpha-L-rhamnosidase [Anaerocolumna xylanovorans]SHO45434.1 alpha-L-rhamnosidase [Anaerocolumna xylanovorans DSM 12503]
MRVVDTKINGIKDPMGFSYPIIKCSWKVVEAKSRYQINAKIVVSETSVFDKILYKKEGRDLNCIGERLEISLKPQTRYYYYIEVTGENEEVVRSETAYFETGKMADSWSAAFIGMKEEDHFHPIFFHKFPTQKKVKSARIYVTGLGLYEASLNGYKIGEDYLAPFCNDYNSSIQYQTYDITEILKSENQIEIMTGNGWYKGRLGYDGDVEYYGNRFLAIAEIHISYENGSKETILTDETWEYRGSDIEMSDIYDGETFNHLLWGNKENNAKPVEVLKESNELKAMLVERYSLPVKVKETLAVKEILHTPAGETVLDMGQNFTGYMEFLQEFSKGTTITLDFGEVLQQGNFYNANYRTAKSRFIYVSDGRKEVVRPHFTYYGFRYVRVTGWPVEIKKENFTGKVVYSDLDIAVTIETSSAKLNQLASNCLWGQKSNFLDMPTDCPQRDERLGWTGDAQVFAPTACFNMDTRAFYRKYLHDLHIDQLQHDGAIANYIPNNSRIPGGSSVWGDAATFIPMTLYEYYGDRDDLEGYYPMMKDWVDYIIHQDKENGEEHLWNFGFHFGDWLAQDGVTTQSMKGGTDDYFIASVYYYASVLKTAKAAGILGKETDMNHYRNKAEKIYQAILEEYFSLNGRLTIDTQTAYFLCLKFDIYTSKDRIITGLKVRLKKDCYKIKGGFVGATMMCRILAENDMEDMAYHILFQEGFPGWMYCVNLGATTIWERWNSILDDGTISGTEMNSLNHYSYGSVMEYVYRNIAGIQEMEPGFKAVRFAPQLNAKLQYVNFTYDSISGKYVSNWKLNKDGTVTLYFEVPFDCTAVAILPGTRGEQVKLEAGTYEKTYRPECDYRKLYNMDTRLEELENDERAMEIIKKELPIAYGLIQSKNPENLSMSMNDLQFMTFMGFRPEMVQKAVEKLSDLI